VNPLKNRDEHTVSSGALRLSAGLGSALVNAHINDSKLASRQRLRRVVDLILVWVPNWTIGAEIGSAAISQLMTQSSVQTQGIDLPISAHSNKQ